jgi:hypothetical protein
MRSPAERSAADRLSDIGVCGLPHEPLELDSLGRLELMMVLEEIAGRELPHELVLSLESHGDVYGWVDQLASQA